MEIVMFIRNKDFYRFDNSSLFEKLSFFLKREHILGVCYYKKNIILINLEKIFKLYSDNYIKHIPKIIKHEVLHIALFEAIGIYKTIKIENIENMIDKL